jgi:hypothetical protein
MHRNDATTTQWQDNGEIALKQTLELKIQLI